MYQAVFIATPYNRSILAYSLTWSIAIFHLAPVSSSPFVFRVVYDLELRSANPVKVTLHINYLRCQCGRRCTTRGIAGSSALFYPSRPTRPQVNAPIELSPNTCYGGAKAVCAPAVILVVLTTKLFKVGVTVPEEEEEEENIRRELTAAELNSCENGYILGLGASQVRV